MMDEDPSHHMVVPVDLGHRSYDIVIGDGVLAEIGPRLALENPDRRVAIVTDDNVAALHLQALEDSLAGANIDFSSIVVPAGEASKNFEQLNQVVEALLAARLERGDAVLALGGGVVGDLTGFAAGIVRRGMDFVQVPTSLLAQVDSSVGGKTGINSPHGKNLIGVFHQPTHVFADTRALDTLSEREFRAGYAEVIKYGLIDRPEFYHWLDDNWQAVFKGGEARAYAIAESCRAKADVVARDELEAGDRALLNLGHTFGHALEGVTGYNSERLVHGEGVAIGMALAHQFSARMNQCSMDDAKQMMAHLQKVGLPTSIKDIPGEAISAAQMMDFIAQDKKVQRGALTFILTHGIGQSYIAKDVPPSEVAAFLEQMTA